MARGQKLALVTGANRGIGFETCRQLADAGFHVMLTSRDPAKGQRAADLLRRQGKDVGYEHLDVTDSKSITRLLGIVRRRTGRLDALVNNAAVYLDEDVSVFEVDEQTVRATLETNFYGPLAMCRTFIPVMEAQRYGRVVNVSSGAGQLSEMTGRSAAYKVSKAALNALTRIVADEVRHANVKVNAACPGWVRTKMGGPHAPRTVEQGADTIVWLATLPEEGPTGGFFRDRTPIAW